ncbi:MAG: hypothetical protein ACOY0T_25480 [Myxococcota bacterium]
MTDTTVLSAPSVPRCRACDAALPPGSSTCENCGAVFGEANRCPHCRAIAGTDMRAGVARCRVCGGPRIALEDPTLVRSGRENALLQQAQRASLGIVACRFGAYAAFGAAGLTMLFAALMGLVIQGLPAPLIVTLFAGLLAGLGVFLNRRSTRAKKEQQLAIDQARQLVLADVLKQRPGIETTELARLFGVPIEQAELLLAELNVSDLLNANMTDASRERLAVEMPYPEADLSETGSVPPTQEAPRLDVTEMAPPLARLDRRS